MTNRETQHPPRDKTGEPLRILVVDDEPAIHFAYRRLIEREGIAVDIGATLSEALHHIRSRPYLALISDMRLAGSGNMDGLEVLRCMLQEQPIATVIITTGFGSKALERQVRDLGAAHYFEKPVCPTVIMAALKIIPTATAGASVEL